MVMGKVSKAIAAGFLCLSLFNSGGDFASAMKTLQPTTNTTTTLPMMNNETEKKGPDQTGKPGEENPEEENPDKKNPDDKKKPDEKKPDDKKKLSETTIRLIIGLVSGFVGGILGFVFGKCVL